MSQTESLTLSEFAFDTEGFAIKRMLDILLSALLLIIFFPFMLLITLPLLWEKGSPWFCHRRIGWGGREFSCLKFRSMLPDAEKILEDHFTTNPYAKAEWLATQKLRNDPRITRIGKFLRTTSLDELPQLLNVLMGDMSLVGPRPIVEAEVAHYGHNIDYYYSMRPGLTGFWQVSGRNDVSYDERVRMDSWYAQNRSLWVDLVIMLKTPFAVFKRSGAY